MRAVTSIRRMGEIDHDQARSFDRVAAAYRRARPGYPAAAVEWLLARAPGRRVVDLAAGTGKLTEALVAAGADVVCVEPLPNMRAELAEAVPGVRVLDGAAEALPLPGGSADAVMVAQAFHWFDAERALAEIARVLVPGGAVGLLWNLRDDGVEWVRDLSAALRGAGDVLSGSRSIAAQPIAHPAFGDVERREFQNALPFDRERLRDWASSTSRIAVLDPHDRERALDAVARLADEHPDLRGRPTFPLPFMTVCVRATRV